MRFKKISFSKISGLPGKGVVLSCAPRTTGDTMKILEELWYGNIDPHGRDIRKDSQMERALSLVVKNDDTLRAMLSDIQKEQYEKLHDSQSEMTDLLEREAFAEGFRLAVKIMIDVMNTMEIPSVDD